MDRPSIVNIAACEGKRSSCAAGSTTSARAEAALPAGARRHRHHPVRGQRRRASASEFAAGRRARRRSRSLAVTGTWSASDARARAATSSQVDGLRGRRRARGLPDHAQGARRRLPAWSTATSGCARAGSTPSCACAHEVIDAIRDFFDGRGFTLLDAPIFTPAACEGTTTLFETDYFGEKAYLTQSGQLYMEAGGDGLRQGLLLRPDLPRREVEDPPPPDRVLDGRAGGRLHGPRRRHGPGRGAVCRVVVAARARTAARRTRGPRARHRAAREGAEPFPRITYDEAVETLQKAGAPMSSGATTSAATRRPSSRTSSTGRSSSTAIPPRSRPST